MSMKVEGVQVFDNHRVIIPATQDTAVTALIELRPFVKYTLLCSTLAESEEVLGEIYDVSRNVWQPWYYAGSRVRLAQNSEQWFFDGTSSLVRFLKSVTANPAGLVLSHPY